MRFQTQDIKELARISNDGFVTATSPNGIGGVSQFIYFIPRDGAAMDAASKIFEKYAIPMAPHMSSLNNRACPILRIPFTTETKRRYPELGMLTAAVNNLIQNPDLMYEPNASRTGQLHSLKSIANVDFKWTPEPRNPLGVSAYTFTTRNMNLADDIAAKLRKHGAAVVMYPDATGNYTVAVCADQYVSARARVKSHKLRGDKSYDYLVTEPIGTLNGHNVYLEILPTLNGGGASVVDISSRSVVVVNINGTRLPFYASSGLDGKESMGIASGKWYPVMGINYWFNKIGDMKTNPYRELDEIVAMLERKFPGAEMKQKGLMGQLPKCDEAAASPIINHSFPEGVEQNGQRNSLTYYKNENLYLPKVINAWQSAPESFLDVHGGPLLQMTDARLHDLQKLLNVIIVNMGDYVKFLPTKICPETELGRHLAQYNIHIDKDFKAPVTDVLGIRGAEPKQYAPQPITPTRDDIVTLARMMAKMYTAQSGTPKNDTFDFVYYSVTNPNQIDVALATFNKYNLDAEQHMSSLDPNAPIIRIPIYSDWQTRTPFLNDMMRDIKTEKAKMSNRQQQFTAGRRNAESRGGSFAKFIKKVFGNGGNNM